MKEFNHRFIDTNRIKMHIAEQGKGPLVILCHGFPESWYSWRHQLTALADAGFWAVAPDQRGYGQTDKPEEIEEYGIFKLAGDIVGLVHALGEDRAIIVGHDWGAPVAWHSALLRPDIFYAAALLSVPYMPRTWDTVKPTDVMKIMQGEGLFYQMYFQEPGKAEAELEADVRKTMRMFLYSAAGDPPPEKRWRFIFDKSEKFLDAGSIPETLPPWLSEEDLVFFTKEFEKSGFRGGLNWYRNVDKGSELTYFMADQKLIQPTLFVAGEEDAVITMYRDGYDNLEQTVPNLTKKVLLPGIGHWVQQEAPEAVNELLVEFVKSQQ
jgi:pimeloyl-ACP methyl ester carboxylesterase